ncbi:MAG: hypothetical protein IJ796_07555 [Lachnospiraceae bacterium]|nr:hypothetical protein [Lachnospiraceae bacterium]
MSARFKFFPQVYTSEGINPRRLFFIRQKIKAHKGGYFIVVPSVREDELLEIFDSKELGKKLYNDRRFIVGGIADNKADALKLVGLIAADCQRIRGDLNLKEFVACGQFF